MATSRSTGFFSLGFSLRFPRRARQRIVNSSPREVINPAGFAPDSKMPHCVCTFAPFRDGVAGIAAGRITLPALSVVTASRLTPHAGPLGKQFPDPREQHRGTDSHHCDQRGPMTDGKHVG